MVTPSIRPSSQRTRTFLADKYHFNAACDTFIHSTLLTSQNLFLEYCTTIKGINSSYMQKRFCQTIPQTSFPLSKFMGVSKHFYLVFVLFKHIFYFIYTYYFDLPIFCCHNVATNQLFCPGKSGSASILS